MWKVNQKTNKFLLLVSSRFTLRATHILKGAWQKSKRYNNAGTNWFFLYMRRSSRKNSSWAFITNKYCINAPNYGLSSNKIFCGSSFRYVILNYSFFRVKSMLGYILCTQTVSFLRPVVELCYHSVYADTEQTWKHPKSLPSLLFTLKQPLISPVILTLPTLYSKKLFISALTFPLVQ